MSALAAGSGVDSMWGYGTDWLYLFGPLGVFGLIALVAIRVGEGRGPVLRMADGFGKATGLPAWAAASFLTGLGGMVIALLGFIWDVSWHIDYGRDDIIFTPGHSAILIGLGFIPVAGALGIAVATMTRADVAIQRGPWRLPWSSTALVVLGLGAMVGFPLDELWHRAYGVDVTMWGPTHITMIGGASFTPLALLALLHEAGPGRRPALQRRMTAIVCGAVLVGLSTFQLEFDLGVSQWQQLFHPVLIAVATGMGMVIARRVLGPGGALIATVHFLLIRSVVALLVGGPLHHSTPRFPLYLGAALAVEVAALLTRRATPLVQALTAGLGVATAGLGGEWAWTHVWGRHPWGGTLAGPRLLLAVVAALAAAVLGTAIAQALAGRRSGLPRGVLPAAGVLVLLALALPLPRHAAAAEITMRTTPAGPGFVNLEVDVTPAGVVEGYDRWDTLSWQGGRSQQAELVRVDADTWRADKPVPVTGDWKTLVRLAKADVLAGAAVYMPADAEIGAAEIPVLPQRTAPFERDTTLLMREAHAGAAWPAVIAYTAVATIVVAWLVALLLTLRWLSRRRAADPVAGKRIAVTGAVGGIGAAVVAALAERGAQVARIDLAGDPDVITADVRDPDATSAAVVEAVRRLGGLDVVINLAGIGRAQDAGELPDVEARRTVDVNFWGTWNVTAAALPWLVESGGHVVITASGLASAVVPWAAAYAASKRAVSAYADTLRLEYAGRLTVTVVDPGYVRTPIHEHAAASGVALEGLVPADSMDSVVDAYLRAIVQRPRRLATSWRTTLLLALARRNPARADAVTLRMSRRLKRGAPAFLLDDAELARRRAVVLTTAERQEAQARR